MNYTPMKYFSSAYEPAKTLCISLEGSLPGDRFNVSHIRPWEYPLYT